MKIYDYFGGLFHTFHSIRSWFATGNFKHRAIRAPVQAKTAAEGRSSGSFQPCGQIWQYPHCPWSLLSPYNHGMIERINLVLWFLANVAGGEDKRGWTAPEPLHWAKGAGIKSAGSWEEMWLCRSNMNHKIHKEVDKPEGECSCILIYIYKYMSCLIFLYIYRDVFCWFQGLQIPCFGDPSCFPRLGLLPLRGVAGVLPGGRWW